MMKDSIIKDLVTFATIYSFLIGVAVFALVGAAVILAEVLQTGG